MGLLGRVSIHCKYVIDFVDDEMEGGRNVSENDAAYE
jgi:hypothetical protein